MTNLHPVSELIDIDHPSYTRTIQCSGVADSATEIVVQLWNPVQFPNGGWVSAVSIHGLSMPRLSAMPGEDALDSLLNTVRFVSDTLSQRGIASDWNGKPLGGFPAF